MAGFTRVPGTDWHVIAKIPTATIRTRARETVLFNVLALGIVLAGAIVAAAFVLRNIETSIASIAATARAYAGGDATSRAAEIGPKEMVTVARQFNVMLDARQQAEALVLRQKQQVDVAINNMSQGLLLFDSSERIIIHNTRYVEMYGLSPDVVKTGCTLRELLRHRAANGQLTRDPEQYRTELMAELAEGRTTVWNVETGDGRIISVVNTPMPDGGWVVTHEDITEAKRAERRVEQTQRFLSTIIEHAPVPMMVKEPATGKIVLINRAYEEFAGQRREHLVGRTARELYAPKQAEMFDTLDAAAIRSEGHMVKNDYSFDTPGNGVRDVTTTRFVVRDNDGNPLHLIVVIEDVTERRSPRRGLPTWRITTC